MQLLAAYVGILIVGEAIAFAIGWAVERAWPAIGLPLFLAMFFAMFWLCWRVALRVTGD